MISVDFFHLQVETKEKISPLIDKLLLEILEISNVALSTESYVTAKRNMRVAVELESYSKAIAEELMKRVVEHGK